MDKKILMFLMLGMFMISIASAFEFDNKLTYEKEDMKVNFDNLFGYGKHFGEIELKSHNSVTEIKGFGFGKEEVVMYYDFTNWELYENGLGDVEFIDMRTEKEIEKDYSFVEWKEVEIDVNDYKKDCDVLENKTEVNCVNNLIGSHKEIEYQWVDYNSKDIPARDVRIGLKTYVGKNDYVDGVWNIVGKPITKHITWSGDLETNLEYYWSFDEGSGTNANENVSGTNDMTLVDGASFVAGKVGNAVSFDGSNDYAQTGSVLDITNESFSIGFWYYSGGLAVQEHIFSCLNYNGGPGFGLMHLTNSTWSKFFGVGSTSVINSVTPIGSWNYRVYTSDTINVKLYENGDFIKQVSNSFTPDGNAKLTLGEDSINTPAREWEGKLDEFGIWQRELSQEEITFLYNDGDGVAYDDLISAPVVTLETPTHNYTNFTTTNEVDFECLPVDYVNDIVNVSLWIDNVLNETNTDGLNESSAHFTKIMSEGEHWFYCDVFSNISETSTTGSYLLDVNTTPNIQFETPTYADYSNITNPYIPVNISLTETFFENITFTFDNDGAQIEYFYDNSTRFINKSFVDGNWSYNVTVWTTTGQSNSTATRNISIDTTPHIQFETPTLADYSNITDPYIPVNVSITETYFDNITFNFWLNGAVTDWNWNDNTRFANETTFADGTWEYNVTVWTTTGQSNSTATRNITLDLTNPLVSASNLSDLVTTSFPINSTWNYTSADTNIDLCYYNTSESTVYNFTTCNATIGSPAWASGGNKTIYFCANDTFGRETCNTEYIFIYSITETSADNPDPVGEGSTATFNFTVNLTSIPTTTATLMINNSVYSPTTTTAGSDGYYFETSFVIPDGWGNTTGIDQGWNWNYTITGISTNASTTSENITVYEMAIDDCSTYAQQILNLSLRDEEGNSWINGSVGSNIEVDINLTSIDDPSITIQYSNTFVNSSNATMCVPLNLINNSNYTIDITIGFDSTNRVWEFWHLDNGTLDLAGNFNYYTSRDVILMDLLTADSTSFLFNYFDVDGFAVDGSLAHVYRKYIGDGEFLEVERSKADQNGDTIVHLVEEDVIYYFLITLDGEILYTSSSYTALCQAVPCTINLEEGGESAEFGTDYDLVDGGGYSINESRSTRMVSLVYSVNETTTMNFTLYKYDYDGSVVQINTTEDTGLNGILTLHVPQSAGNVSFFASVVKDDVFINSEWVDFEGQAVDYFGNALAIFLGALLILTLGLMAISSGAGVLLWVMVGLIVSGALGLFATNLNSGVSIIIYLILAGALLLWKITGGRK